MNHEQNLRLTQVAPGTAGGLLQRRFWQPVALAEEFDAAIECAANTSLGFKIVSDND